jgi:hypothetical protein
MASVDGIHRKRHNYRQLSTVRGCSQRRHNIHGPADDDYFLQVYLLTTSSRDSVSFSYRKETDTTRMGIERLIDKAGAYIKEKDLLRITEAYEFADQAHHGQVRKSGEPYILHPLAVADIVVNMQMDVISIIAALSA